MPALAVLDAGQNQLKVLQPRRDSFTALTWLDLRENQIEKLGDLRHMPALR